VFRSGRIDDSRVGAGRTSRSLGFQPSSLDVVPRLSPLAAHALLGSVVALGTSLAICWALFVPILQDPDESAHIDYAFSILTGQRLMLSTGQTISTDVHPYTRYLEAVTGFRGMRYSSYGRVPEGYGTRAYFARVDAGAPHVTPASSDTRPLPLYAHAYPFGFYALEAGVMALAGWFHPGSLVSQFFAARLFCVALLVPTLLCSYGIFRYTKLSRTVALLLTASIAFFPLTSSIFAYVQPDDFVAALVTAILLAALHLRDAPRWGTAAIVGTLLAALALTKYHDALVLSAVIAFMAATRRRVRSTLPYVVGPPLVAFAAAAFVMGSVQPAHRFLCANVGEALRAAVRGGPQNLMTYLVAGGTDFLASTFVGGWSFLEYWDSIGWLVHRILFGTLAITDVVAAILCFFTVVVVLLMLVRANLVFLRLVTVARKRTIATAIRLASGDVIFNGYMSYLVCLLAANAYSGNRLAQGRYWLPFIVCALLFCVRYVPHLTGRRIEGSLAKVVAGSLALYSALAVVPALATVDRSYYRSRPSAAYVEPWARFDESTSERFATLHHVREGSALFVSGSAIDGPSEAVARGVSLLLDGRRRIALRYGAVHPEVVCLLNDVSLARSGFHGSFSTAHLSPGRHWLELEVSEAEFPAPVPTTKRLDFIIDPRSAHAANTFSARR
jgi:hypothetical protein